MGRSFRRMFLDDDADGGLLCKKHPLTSGNAKPLVGGLAGNFFLFRRGEETLAGPDGPAHGRVDFVRRTPFCGVQ